MPMKQSMGPAPHIQRGPPGPGGRQDGEEKSRVSVHLFAVLPAEIWKSLGGVGRAFSPRNRTVEGGGPGAGNLDGP